jgi:hypothetical protein
MNAPTATAADPSNPAHPHHHFFNWGVFLALLTIAAQGAAPIVGSLVSPQIGAALAGGASVLGKVDTALITAQTDQTDQAAQ